MQVRNKINTNKQDKYTAINTYNIGSQSVNYANNAGSANAVDWDKVSGKPSSFVPSSHTHDDRYYTEAEVVNLIDSRKVIIGGTTNNAYYKFADGLLICTQNNDVNVGCTNKWGAMYESNELSFDNWAHNFINTPHIAVATRSIEGSCAVESFKSTSNINPGKTFVYRPTESIVHVRLNIIAFGRWK